MVRLLMTITLGFMKIAKKNTETKKDCTNTQHKRSNNKYKL